MPRCSTRRSRRQVASRSVIVTMTPLQVFSELTRVVNISNPTHDHQPWAVARAEPLPLFFTRSGVESHSLDRNAAFTVAAYLA